MAREKLERLKQVNAPLKRKTDAYGERTKCIKRRVEYLTNRLNEVKRKIQQCEDKFPGFDQMAADWRVETSNIRKKANQRRKKLHDLAEEVNKLETGLEKSKEKLDSYGPDNREQLSVIHSLYKF